MSYGGMLLQELTEREAELAELEAELANLRKTLAEVRAQRDEWEQIATGYRHRLLSTGVGLSNVSS